MPTSRGPSTLATFVAVYALFGPTFAGTYDKDRGIYMLFYPVYILGLEYILYSINNFYLFNFLILVFRVFPLHFLFQVSILTAAVMEEVFIRLF